jgi:hypothetical protein
MNTLSPRYHILLVGIDAYQKVDPLHGCVNDVDSLEAIFLNQLSVDPRAITKLVAPHTGSLRTSTIAEDKPTSSNIRKALEALGTDTVRPGDRVFIHFSGHGTQVLSRATRTAREALVPVDVDAGGDLLFDYEVNELLRGIAARTDDLTVVLDCCCSAGATRSTLLATERSIRFCRIGDSSTDVSFPRHRGSERSAGLTSSFDPSDPGFLVVASAQSCEAAHEGRDSRGVRHGAFTAALLDLLAREPTENLHVLRWADVWQSLRARVTSAFPGQNPCLIGRGERRVFGGPFRRQDPGFPITEIGGTYQIHAGTLVGLGVGAKVAVYGPEPAFFPTLHSAEDFAARRGLLHVERTSLSSAMALPVGGAFRLGDGARGRFVTPGIPDRLVVGLDPFDADLARYLESEAPVVVVPLAERGAHELEAVVGSSADGCYWIGDDVFGPEAPLARTASRDRAELARGLWHYVQYNLSLRLVRRCRDWTGALQLRVLDARRVAMIESEELHDPPLPEAESDDESRYRYQLTDGQPVCFTVENRSSKRLYTHVINCSASGKVEILGPKQLEVLPGRRQAFWMGGHLGRAFPCSLSAGRVSNVERLVAIGTTSPKVDLSYLRVKESFAYAMTKGNRDTASTGEPTETWTATMVTVRIARR